MGVQPGLANWPMDDRRRPPPLDTAKGHKGGMYDSVSGTEADLTWTRHERFRNQQQGTPVPGSEMGRQFVTFNPWQAYPRFVVHLEKT